MYILFHLQCGFSAFEVYGIEKNTLRTELLSFIIFLIILTALEVRVFLRELVYPQEDIS